MLYASLDGVYVGGSTSQSDNDFKEYINSKPEGDFGKCGKNTFTGCYFYLSEDIQRDEQLLLDQKPSCNKIFQSGLLNDPGYVYVCRKNPATSYYQP